MIVLLWIPACFFAGLLNRDLLPDKYFFDDAHIQSVMPTADGPSADSFVTMAWIYRGLGLMGNQGLVQAGTMLLFFVLLFTCARWRDIARFGVVEIAVFCVSGLACAVYLAQYSKESLVLVLVLALMWLPRNLLGDLVFAALACGYAALVRPYWFMVAAVFLLLRLLFRYGRKEWLVPVLLVLVLLAFAIGVSVFLGADLNTFREGVAQFRTNSPDARSAIQDYLPAKGVLGGTGNALLTLILLIVPIPLLLAGSPVYLGFAVVSTALWIGVLFPGIRRGFRSGWFTDSRFARAAALLLAMVTVQAVFEPDYGSYLKHLTPLLPLFLVLLVHRRARLDSNPTSPR
ncbi:hypothetical protein [Sciscionella sediminilitoris]|uniref:hypothetical protein n=1 Tax=Sciscionella sediminilitoris TaxID=1445613 RepID=UPI0004DF726B|nr:hypothetical protein [Sciscionella sp. SE31]